MLRDLSAKYCLKKKLQKRAPKSYQDLPQNIKTNSKNMVVNNKKTFLRMKNIGWLRITKNSIMHGKKHHKLRLINVFYLVSSFSDNSGF